jgi:RNA polymerase sigma factor for flagellar operon FliA
MPRTRARDRLARLDRPTRDLVERCLPLVEYQASRLLATLPDWACVELADLVSAGVFGLVDAIAAFDPGRGVRFATYAGPRIRGAMLDDLREQDWAPRLVRRRSAQFAAARHRFRCRVNREPSEAELARLLGVPSIERFRAIAPDGEPVGTASLSRKWFETDGGRDVRESDTVADRRGADEARREAGYAAMRELIGEMSRVHRMILTLYYGEDMRMKEIARAIGFTESRCSQLHAEAIAIMRARHGVRAAGGEGA